MKVFLTGAKGFIGRNLAVFLKERPGVRVWEFDRDSRPEVFRAGLAEADAVIHLAGVNRPEREEEHEEGNAELTRRLCAVLSELGRRPRVIFSSSVQALKENPYGISKRKAEEVLLRFRRVSGAPVFLFRLPGVFGKWCRPDYNSVTATFCHNIARGFPVSIADPAREIDLVYIDDVGGAFLRCLDGAEPEDGEEFQEVRPVYRVSLGDLARKIEGFKKSRENLVLPDFSDSFTRRLYAVYLSHLPPEDFAYPLVLREDARGVLAEFLKQGSFGQLFVSRTRPGAIRGGHFHHTKTERFLVVEGEAVVRFRRADGGEVLEYRLDGRRFKVLDIPPGYAHTLENVGSGELVTLFWASEAFDPLSPDTVSLKV